jgi:hypothetical protein
VGETLYHVELRHFPRNVWRFNLSGEELRVTLLEPWVADRMFDLGELRWDPRHARLMVLEGPRLEPAQLTMGRGWRAAQRQGRDVTERLLAATREALGTGVGGSVAGVAGPVTGVGGSVTDVGSSAAGGGDAAGSGGDLAADSLGLELLAQIGPDQVTLRRAWELAAARDPSGAASDALALAERAVASLLRARLVVLLCAHPPETGASASDPHGGSAIGPHGGSATDPRTVGAEDTATVLRTLDSWISDGQGAGAYLRRA